MKIIRDKVFVKSLQSYIKYISYDSIKRAIKFEKDLNKKINSLTTHPYKFRKSYHYDHDRIRDLIFKGYTIPYLIDEKNDKIVILDIFKWQNK